MSFALTTEQIRHRTKTVTRRKGWASLKPGTLLQPVVKGMGLKEGEQVETIGGPIRVLKVERVVLSDITTIDVYREGFGNLTQRQFIEMFKKHMGGLKDQIVTRIEFEYVDAMKEEPLSRLHTGDGCGRSERSDDSQASPARIEIPVVTLAAGDHEDVA